MVAISLVANGRRNPYFGRAIHSMTAVGLMLRLQPIFETRFAG
jgi:hypothetical protein